MKKKTDLLLSTPTVFYSGQNRTISLFDIVAHYKNNWKEKVNSDS